MPRTPAQQAYDYAERVRARLARRLQAVLEGAGMTLTEFVSKLEDGAEKFPRWHESVKNDPTRRISTRAPAK